MKIAGLVGGIAPASTVDYYERILTVAASRGATSAPQLIINSICARTVLDYAARDRESLAAYLLDALNVLDRAGAVFAAFLSNTPHLVFDQQQKGSRLPILGIVDVVAEKAAAEGFRRVGLLGTRFTMEADFYPNALAGRGVELVIPSGSERAAIHSKYVNELAMGIFEPSTRAEFTMVIERLAAVDRVDAVILGGTEIPILLDGLTGPVPLLNTAALHADAIVERILAT
jgi:aspartate racemase